MIRVWAFDDPSIPEEIAKAAWRSGDEDWVIAAPMSQAGVFVCFLDRFGLDSTTYVTTTYNGEEWLVYTDTHA